VGRPRREPFLPSEGRRGKGRASGVG
jgi:hypothetical protein